MALPLTLYRFATGLFAGVAPLWLWARSRRGKEDAARIAERYGRDGSARPEGRLIWCHAASVGESLTLLPLLGAILKRANGKAPCHIVVTTGTVTSAALMAERLPQAAFHRYVPLDHGPWVARFLDHWRPDLVMWTESELWPNTLLEIAARRIPAVLVNGRLSDKALRGWQRWPGFARMILQGFHTVLAQSPEDGRRFEVLGAPRVTVVGNLKLAAAPLPADPDAVVAFTSMTARRPLWLAASIHPGEDAVAAASHAALKPMHPGLLTVIVPRHPAKGLDMGEVCRANGLRVAYRSRGEPVTQDTDVYIADTMGELGLFYRACDLVFMGKSLAVGGGQNPAEAALMGCALLLGPDMSNFRDMTTALCEARAAVQVSSAADLTATLGRLLNDTAARRTMGANGRAFMEAEGHGLAQTISALAPFLDEGRTINGLFDGS